MRAMFFSVGIVSAVFIALQLNLIRILSTLLSYHFVFSVVSLAMLGLGLGGLIVQRFPAKDAKKALIFFLWLSLISTAFSLFAVLWMAQYSFFFEHYYVYFLVLLVPFVFGGAFFSQAYQGYSSFCSQLYAADLFGAALGCILGVVLLDWLGAFIGVLVLIVLLAISVFFMRRGRGAQAAVVVSVLLLLFGGTHSQTVSWLISVERNPIKEISDALGGPLNGEVTRQKWSAFGLTEQVEYQNTDEHRDIYIDGTAGTPMYAFSGDFNKPGVAVKKLFKYFPGALPFKVIPNESKGRALIIGPGGGRDILLTAGFGYKEIVGVEVNPDLLAMVRAQSDYNGGLYTDIEYIDIVQAEGRHYIQRDRSEYDLIMLSLPVTNTSRSPEGFSLTENFLLTAEAIQEYFEHLNDDGFLMVIAHDELAVLRLIITALDAYEKIGINQQQAFKRLYVQGSFPYPVVLFGKEPISLKMSEQLLRESKYRNYSMNASYFPGIIEPGMGNPMLQSLAVGGTTVDKVQEHVWGMGYDISSITDDRPFFYHFDIAPPKNIINLFFTAFSMLCLSWVWPSFIGFKKEAQKSRVRLPAFSTAFAGLGVGFMLLEIVFIQKLTFYLGDPVLALALLLAILLLGMALGSRITIFAKSPKLLPVQACSAALLVCVVGGIYLFLIPVVLSSTLVWTSLMRILLAAAFLLPIGVALGFCFPLLIRMLRVSGNDEYIPWMWAINGFSSVVGASAAVIGGLYIGFQQTFLFGLLCYVVVALSVFFTRGSFVDSISAIPRCVKVKNRAQ